MGRKGQGCGGGAGRGAIERDGRRSDNVDTGQARRRLRARSGHARRRRGARRGRVGDGGGAPRTERPRGRAANREGGAGLGREDAAATPPDTAWRAVSVAAPEVVARPPRTTGATQRAAARARGARRADDPIAGRAEGSTWSRPGVGFAVPPEAIGRPVLDPTGGSIGVSRTTSTHAPARTRRVQDLTGRRVQWPARR